MKHCWKERPKMTVSASVSVSAEIKCSLLVSVSFSVQVARGSFGFGRNWKKWFRSVSNLHTYTWSLTLQRNENSSSLQFEVAYWPALAVGCTAHLAPAQYLNERTLDQQFAAIQSHLFPSQLHYRVHHVMFSRNDSLVTVTQIIWCITELWYDTLQSLSVCY